MKHYSFFTLVLFLTCCSAAAFAADLADLSAEPKPPTRFQNYLTDTDKKFDRGALNFVAGWTEWIRQPIYNFKNSDKKNKWAYAAQGAGVGAVDSVVDVTGGFFNALTSMFPSWEIPLPQDGIKAEKITGGNAEVFPNELETESITSEAINKTSTNY